MSETSPGSVLRDSGLETTLLAFPNLQLRELTGLDLCTYRGHPARVATPPGWPGAVGEVSGKDPALCCLRPGEWLRISTSAEPPAADTHGLACIDHSHGWAVLRITGATSPWLLAQLGALDFHGLFLSSVPRCERARLGHAAVVVLTRPAAEHRDPGFDLLVDRSLARYLWERLAAAAAHTQRWVQPSGN